MIFGHRRYTLRSLAFQVIQNFGLDDAFRLLLRRLVFALLGLRDFVRNSRIRIGWALRRNGEPILAQGAWAEKPSDLYGRQISSWQSLAAIVQMSLATLMALGIWLYLPHRAAAPVDSLLQPESGIDLGFGTLESPTTSSQPETQSGAQDPIVEATGEVTSGAVQPADPVVFIDSAPAEPMRLGLLPVRLTSMMPDLNESEEQSAQESMPIGEPEVTFTAPVSVEALPSSEEALRASIGERVAAIAQAPLDPSIFQDAPPPSAQTELDTVPLALAEPLPTPVPTVDDVDFTLRPGRVWESFLPGAPEFTDHFWIDPVFPTGLNQLYSPNYQFGSTAGGRYRIHHGLDLSNPAGSPVLAGAAGEVVHAGPDNPSLLGPYNNFYGNAVVIRLDRRILTAEGEQDVYLLYGHLSKVTAVRGERVESGASVGEVGMTGIAIGPHLHVEVRVGQNSYQTSVNPATWISPLPGSGAVAVRLLTDDGRTWPGAWVSLIRYDNSGSRWVRTIETYRDEEPLRSDPAWGENGALGNIPAGNYYVTATVNGEKVGQNVVVRAGETTFVELRTAQ